MASPAPALFCPPEYVCTSWIASIAGFPADYVGPIRPQDDATWQTNGAVTMFVVGGVDDPVFPYSKYVYQVECWAASPESDEPPWLMAENLAAQIRLACLDRLNMGRPLEIAVNGVVYPGANVRAAYTRTAPRRVYGDRADHAVVIFDLELDWAQENLVIR